MMFWVDEVGGPEVLPPQALACDTVHQQAKG